MSLFLCWVVFPLVLGALALGCGLALEAASGIRLPGVLLVSSGLAVLVVAGQFVTMTGATAELAAPLIVLISAAGFTIGRPWRTRRLDGWALLAPICVYAAFAAPVVLSGEATLAGFIKLDDTASWLGITDRVFSDGYDHSGLAPSTHEAMLQFYLGSDYPVGSLVPLGITQQIVGQDLAWLYQPYLAFLAAVLASGLYQLGSVLIASRPLLALTTFVASQPAILFGYALLGGAKEVGAAWLVTLAIALVPLTLAGGRRLAAVAPMAVAAAAMIGVLSFGGAIWLVPAGVVLGAALIRPEQAVFGARQAAALAGLLALLLIPSYRGLDFLGSSAASTVTEGSRLANLFHPLNGLQVFGIWPVGDFRLTPRELDVAYVLIAVLVAAGCLGAYWAWKRRAWTLLLYLVSASFGALVIAVAGSPWVEAKAFAMASPAFVLIAMVGVVSMLSNGRRVEATAVAVAIVAGVLWSNVLAYHSANLAPRPQLAELERIGSQIAGEGPTLMTEFSPFGARYFLRDADPESASTFRRRNVYLRGRTLLAKGRAADVDRFELDEILVYRTLVLRRSPLASQPPAPYRLAERGRYYDVWQRAPIPNPGVIEHLPLGSELRPGGVPSCPRVAEFARLPGATDLVAAPADSPLVVGVANSDHPRSWAGGPVPGSLSPTGSGKVNTDAQFPASARYLVWIGGSFGGKVTVSVDGRTVGGLRNRLNNEGGYEFVGQVSIGAGQRSIEIDYDERGLYPGSEARPTALGPLVFAVPGGQGELRQVPVSDARSLCGKRWDWIEAVR